MAEPNATTKLIEALFQGVQVKPPDFREVAKLLRTNPNIDAPCSLTGMTLLQSTIQRKDPLGLLFCIARGASINARGIGKYDCLPLDLAASCGNNRVIDILAERNAQSSSPVLSQSIEFKKSCHQAALALSKQAKSKKFQGILKEVQSMIGLSAKRDRKTGCFIFKGVSFSDLLTLQGTNEDKLDQVVTAFSQFSNQVRKCGAILFCQDWLGYSLKKTHLILAPEVDEMQLIQATADWPALNPLTQNHELYKVLLSLYENCSFRLLSISPDAIIISFPKLPNDLHSFSNEILNRLPFLSSYHTAGAGKPELIDVKSIIEEELSTTQTLQIIFHNF